MKRKNFIIACLFFIAFLNNSIAQKSGDWHQVKSPELNQPFGFVWSFNNSIDYSHQKCKGHEHSKITKTNALKKAPALKSTFTVTETEFNLNYSNVSKNNTSSTVISYTLLDGKGNILKAKTSVQFKNSTEQNWSTKNIDISNYMNQTITIIINIEEQLENSTLFINLFQ